MKINEIRRTCFACPAQWEGTAESGYVYIRFRWGHLAVSFGSTIENAIAGQILFEWDDADDLNGFMEYDELKKITAGVLDLPETEIEDDRLISRA